MFVGSVYQFFELKAGPGTNQDHVSPIAAKPNPVVPTNLHQPLHTFKKIAEGYKFPLGSLFPVPILLEQGIEAAVCKDAQLFKRSEDSKE